MITAQQLPKLNKEKSSSIVDPFVRIEIHGIPADCCKKQTEYRLNNGETKPRNENNKENRDSKSMGIQTLLVVLDPPSMMDNHELWTVSSPASNGP